MLPPGRGRARQQCRKADCLTMRRLCILGQRRGKVPPRVPAIPSTSAIREVLMKPWLVGLFVLLAPTAFAQSTTAPEIPFDSVPNLLKLPPDMYLREAFGVAVNSKGHIFVYSRGGSSQGPAFANTASQILEFGPDGKYV